MQNERQPSENFHVSNGELEKNIFDGNKAPIVKDSSGSVTITYNTYVNDTKGLPHSNLGRTTDEPTNTVTSQENEINSNKTVRIRDKLDNLIHEKRELEKRLEYIESEIARTLSELKSQTDPGLGTLLHWLSGRKNLAEKYGKIALKGFQSLRRESEEKGNLDDFYFQIEHYLELIHLSLLKNNKLFLQEPGIPPTFADFDTYEYASHNLYIETFRILKENIPQDNVELSLRSKLEEQFDELLRRLQVYF